MQKNWSTPQLIVFSKGNPEEAVLAVCKTHGNPSGSQGNNNTCKPPPLILGGPACPMACQGVTGT
jgi:hypothetical protein